MGEKILFVTQPQTVFNLRGGFSKSKPVRVAGVADSITDVG
jgi:hypothetical protein